MKEDLENKTNEEKLEISPKIKSQIGTPLKTTYLRTYTELSEFFRKRSLEDSRWYGRKYKQRI